MKKILTFILLIYIALPLLATSEISGKIIDGGTQTPLDFVNVALFKQGSEVPTTGVSSDKAGAFTIPAVANGRYVLRVSFIGYNPVNQNINVNGKSINIGTIKMLEDSKKLDEVIVVGQGSQMRFDVDKKIYSVDQSIAAAGGSASDVLKNIPSVKVDNEGNVSLRKDANVEVWVNGKPSGLTADNRAQVLQQMPAESIESIEIMTNPSAKFNPEGTAGIINLVMKKNRKAGYYGSLSGGLMYPTGAKLGGSLGANINYSSSKVDAYLNIGYRAMSFKGGGYNDRYNYGTDTTRLYQTNVSGHAFSGLFMRAGIDYHLDDKNTIGVSGFGMAGSGSGTDKINYLKTDVYPLTTLADYNRNNIGTGTRPSLNMNLDYKHDFDKKGTNLMASVAYSTHTRGGDNQYLQTDNLSNYSSDITQSSTSKNNELMFKLDYTNKFTESSRLEAGMQSTISDRLSNASALNNVTQAPLLTYNNVFDYNEQIHAAYLTYGDRFDKLSVQVGMRAEYMKKESSNTAVSKYSTLDTIQTINTPATIQFFPSMYLSYSLPNNNELQLNYTRRVNRPRGRQINPFRDYSDSTNITYGKPDLAPEYSSSFEFNYMKTWDNHSISASAYYRFTDNVIEDVRFINAGVMESTYMNIAKKENTGMELVAKNRLFTILNLTSSVNLYYNKMNASVYTNPYNSAITTTIPGQSNFTWSANILANLMFSKTFSGQITGDYSAPTIIAQGTQGAEYSINLGLRKTFFDRKLSLNFTANDIFDMNRERSTTSGTGFYQKSESYFHGRMIGLSVSYNFGNMKPKQAEMKKKAASGDMNMDMGE
ncbi:MAG: TonB-dependent receptor [Paludibacter sp.]